LSNYGFQGVKSTLLRQCYFSLGGLVSHPLGHYYTLTDKFPFHLLPVHSMGGYISPCAAAQNAHCGTRGFYPSLLLHVGIISVYIPRNRALLFFNQGNSGWNELCLGVQLSMGPSCPTGNCPHSPCGDPWSIILYGPLGNLLGLCQHSDICPAWGGGLGCVPSAKAGSGPFWV